MGTGRLKEGIFSVCPSGPARGSRILPLVNSMSRVPKELPCGIVDDGFKITGLVRGHIPAFTLARV